MESWSVLGYGFYIGLGFTTLWIAGTIRGEGMWGNTLLFFDWCLAATGTWAFWQPTVALVLEQIEPSSDDYFTILLVAFLALFGLFVPLFLLLRMMTDALSGVKVAFHPILDAIGSVVYCLLLSLGIALMSWPVKILMAMGKSASWLQGAEGGMAWQAGAMYFAFWVATAVEVAILSKSAKRNDRPKKSESQAES